MPRRLPDLRTAPLHRITLRERQIRALAGSLDTWQQAAEGGWSGRGSAAMADALDRRGLVAALAPTAPGDHLEVQILKRGVDWLALNKALLTDAERLKLERLLADAAAAGEAVELDDDDAGEAVELDDDDAGEAVDGGDLDDGGDGDFGIPATREAPTLGFSESVSQGLATFCTKRQLEIRLTKHTVREDFTVIAERWAQKIGTTIFVAVNRIATRETAVAIAAQLQLLPGCEGIAFATPEQWRAATERS